MIVVMDSNQFYGDPLMAGRELGIILGQHSRTELVLAVPEVVVREVPKLFREQFIALRDKQAAGALGLEKLGYKVAVANLPTAEKATTDYKSHLRQRLAAVQAEIPPLPQVSVSELVDDSIAERRPWQARSRGFRDALIWQSVLDLAVGDQVILISNNPDDFAISKQKPGVLHPQLQQQVEAIGHGADRIRLVPTIEDFISEFVPVADQALLAARELLATDQEFKMALYGEIDEALYRFDFQTANVTIIPHHFGSVEMVTVDDVSIDGVEITAAYEGEDESVFTEIRVQAVMYFGFVTDVSGAEWLIEEGADIEITDWEESFAIGRTHARYVNVTYWADFDPKTAEVGELEQTSATDDEHVG